MSFSILLHRAGFWAALTLLAISSARAGQPPADGKEQTLTPERAKEALLKMMRAQAGNDVGWFSGDIPDEMAKIEISREQDGWYAWTAAFRFHPSQAIYTFVVRPKPGVNARVLEYEGSFLRKEGAWSATTPKLVRTTIQ